MFKEKPFSELLFHIVMTIVCFLVLLFIIKLLGYDDSKYNPKSQIMQCEGQITDFREVKGDLYFCVEDIRNIEFKTDLCSLISKKNFEEKVQNGAIFKISYSNNTLHENQCEVITLSSEDIIIVSQDSRSKAVTSNIIIYGIGLLMAVIGTIYFSFGIVQWFR